MSGADQEITRLAALPLPEYGPARKALARKWNVPVGMIDQEVNKARAINGNGNASGSGQAVELQDVEPAEEPVNGSGLLMMLTTTLNTYAVLPRGADVAIALWIIRAFAHDTFTVNPRLIFQSPEKRCGKTTLLELLHSLTPRPLMSSNITPAALFRLIEHARPTLLIDEVDTFHETNEELRGILNSGHTRAGARVIRTVGDNHEPRAFSTWCPMVLAAIGRLPGTLEDRSIIIQMRRKKTGEDIKPLPRKGKVAAAFQERCQILTRSCARWIQDHREKLEEAEPEVPDSLNDRAANNWAPLLAIADIIGGDWPEKARQAALTLSGHEAADTQNVRVQLLADIREIFSTRHSDRLASQTLCNRLIDLEERPWSEWRKGKPITPNQLARLLHPFEIRSRNLKQPDSSVAKGYTWDDFTDAWDRYLPAFPEEGDSNRYSATSRASSGNEAFSPSATQDNGSGSENRTNPAPDAAGSAVAVQKGGSGDGDLFEEGIDLDN